MAATAENNYGFDSSKLQPASAPPPVTGGSATSGATAGTNNTDASASGVGPGYGGYAESTGMNNDTTGTGTGTGTGMGTGAGIGGTTTHRPPPPPPPPASGGTKAGVTGYDAGAGTGTGTGATTGGGYGATGGTYGGATGGNTSSDKAKAFATRGYNRFIKPGGRAGAAEKEWDIPLAILAVFVPPLAVFFKVGLINSDFVINVCLTILAWFPGVLHAWYVIFIQRGNKARGAPVDSTTYNANARHDKTL